MPNRSYSNNSVLGIVGDVFDAPNWSDFERPDVAPNHAQCLETGQSLTGTTRLSDQTSSEASLVRPMLARVIVVEGGWRSVASLNLLFSR